MNQADKASLARICSCGCGRALLDERGWPDFSRKRFATKECLARDKARRTQMRRLKMASADQARISVDGGAAFTPGLPVRALAAQLRRFGHEVEIIRPV